MSGEYYYLIPCILALRLVQNASAQAENQWTGLAGDGLWGNPGNWSAGVPTAGQSVGLAPANGSSVATIVPGEVGHAATIFGPEWGMTLNIFGALQYGWYLTPLQSDQAKPGTINLYDNGSVFGEGLALGDNWWWSGGPYVKMNMYSNSFAGINWFWWGGRLNLYDNAVFSITNGVTTQTAGVVSDATRSINLEGKGTLVLPSSFTATVANWISRGILLVYGVPGDSPEIVISETNTTWPGRTVVTTTATNANPMQAIRITVPRTNLYVGGLEQAGIYADYAHNTNVDVTGLSGLGITYQSTATGVATISTNGRVRAVGVGSATLNVFLGGGLSNSVSVTVAAYTNTASLVHRYSFSETTGTTVADSVGGTDWDGTLYGGATLTGGAAVLDGSSAYVQLPAGIVSNLDAVTIEAWVNFGTPAGYAALFAFGDQNSLLTPQGKNYIAFQPFTGLAAPTAAALVGKGDPGNSDEQDAVMALVSNGVTNLLGDVHLVVVYHPYAGYVSFYTNGVPAAINSNVSNPLASTLDADPLNYLGQSLDASDPYLAATINEFRIYDGPLSAAQITVDHALGPDQLIGTNKNVMLSAAALGRNIVISWPTTSAPFTLLSSTLPGAGASWAAFTGGTLTVSGGNYQLTIPASDSTRYFRLRL